jgi:hypothetical protein
MAAGAGRVLQAAVGLAVTGVGGPGPQEGKAPGTVLGGDLAGAARRGGPAAPGRAAGEHLRAGLPACRGDPGLPPWLTFTLSRRRSSASASSARSASPGAGQLLALAVVIPQQAQTSRSRPGRSGRVSSTASSALAVSAGRCPMTRRRTPPARSSPSGRTRRRHAAPARCGPAPRDRTAAPTAHRAGSPARISGESGAGPGSSSRCSPSISGPSSRQTAPSRALGGRPHHRQGAGLRDRHARRAADQDGPAPAPAPPRCRRPAPGGGSRLPGCCDGRPGTFPRIAEDLAVTWFNLNQKRLIGRAGRGDPIIPLPVMSKARRCPASQPRHAASASAEIQDAAESFLASLEHNAQLQRPAPCWPSSTTSGQKCALHRPGHPRPLPAEYHHGRKARGDDAHRPDRLKSNPRITRSRLHKPLRWT